MWVDAQIRTFISSLLQSVGVVVGVVVLFMGLRTGLVVASLVPVTIIAALFLMSVFSIGLNQVSLAALILALGMLVDNAIVMTEAITMQMAVGRRPLDAAINSARELRRPLLVASLTTAAAFLPIFLAESQTGEYTAPLFKVVTIALLSSWILALTMTPLLCVRFLRSQMTPDGEQAGPGALDESFFVARSNAPTSRQPARPTTAVSTDSIGPCCWQGCGIPRWRSLRSPSSSCWRCRGFGSCRGPSSRRRAKRSSRRNTICQPGRPSSEPPRWP